MKFRKSFRFHDKIFKSEDIKAIWKYVSALRESDSKGVAEIVIRNEGDEVSSEDDLVFDSFNFLRKDIKEIKIEYRSEDYNSRVLILINDVVLFSLPSDNYVNVESHNEQWAEANVAKLHDIINCVEQISWVVRMYRKVSYLFQVIFCILTFNCYLNNIIPWIMTHYASLSSRFAVGALIFGVLVWIYWKINQLNEHLKVVAIDVNGNLRQRKNKILSTIWSVICVIIIPVLIAWYFSCSHSKSGDSQPNISQTIMTGTTGDAIN